jgi:hypothetical protein
MSRILLGRLTGFELKYLGIASAATLWELGMEFTSAEGLHDRSRCVMSLPNNALIFVSHVGKIRKKSDNASTATVLDIPN